MANISVPNVVGLTQTAATSELAGAGLTLGVITSVSSSIVPSGNVVSQLPAAGALLMTTSPVNLTVSSGPAVVSVPSLAGMSLPTATSTLTQLGLVVGAITMVNSAAVPVGNVISQDPFAGDVVAAGSAINLTESSGVPASAGFVYSSNFGDGTLSAYSIDAASGSLTPLAPSSIAPPRAFELGEAKIDSSGKYLYVVDTLGMIFGFAMQADGSLIAVPGSPFAAGRAPVSLAFDPAGRFLYVANASDGTLSGYSLDSTTGTLTPLAKSPYSISGTDPYPNQIATTGNFLYVADNLADSIQVFTISSTGDLTQSVSGPAFPLGTSAMGLAVDPSGSVLYASILAPSGVTALYGFTINVGSGALTPVAVNPPQFQVDRFISFDKLGKFLLVPGQGDNGVYGLAVYPYDAATGVLGSPVGGSPFATGMYPVSVSVDPTDHFVYTANDQSANISEFTLDAATGVLTSVAGSPASAGLNPDFIAIK
jgi:6-phosphogluconolactonase